MSKAKRGRGDSRDIGEEEGRNLSTQSNGNWTLVGIVSLLIETVNWTTDSPERKDDIGY
jgi:hypothetical protein